MANVNPDRSLSMRCCSVMKCIALFCLIFLRLLCESVIFPVLIQHPFGLEEPPFGEPKPFLELRLHSQLVIQFELSAGLLFETVPLVVMVDVCLIEIALIVSSLNRGT